MRLWGSLFLLLAFASVGVLAACVQPTISQSKQTGWTDGNGVQFSVWDGFITASSSSAISTVTFTIGDSNTPIYQFWEADKQFPDLPLYSLPQWRLQNGGIPAGQSHKFGYIIRWAQAADVGVSSWTCPGETNPSPLPSPSPSPSSPSPTPEPQQPTGAVCSGVLVIDNYIVRNAPGLTAQQIKDKYLVYFADVTAYYAFNFGIQLNWDFVYVETTGSFTDTMDGGELLDNFSLALQQNIFGQPSGACIYHLLTGRQPAGVGGLAWVNSACSESGPGFSVDGLASESPELVIRRSIHEIGHNFGGNHPDAYPSSLGYTCSTNDDREPDRILRSDIPSYTYLSPAAFISDCATQSIKSSLPSFSCMWSPDVNNAVLPRAVLCTEENGEGRCLTVAAHYGTSQCYNVLPINDDASSFQLFAAPAQAVGLRLYLDIDCLGDHVDVLEYYSPSLPAGFDNVATSFRFIRQ